TMCSRNPRGRSRASSSSGSQRAPRGEATVSVSRPLQLTCSSLLHRKQAFDRHDDLVVEMLRIELRDFSIGGCHGEILRIRYVADRGHANRVEGAAFAGEHAAAEEDNAIERAGNRVVEDLNQRRICWSGFG